MFHQQLVVTESPVTDVFHFNQSNVSYSEHTICIARVVNFTVIITFLLVGTVSNVSVIGLIVLHRSLHHTNYYLLLHLACCDLLSLWISSVMLLKETLCGTLNVGPNVFVMLCSARAILIMVILLNIFLIFLDRTMTAYATRLHSRQLSKSVLCVLIVLGWLMGVLRCAVHFVMIGGVNWPLPDANGTIPAVTRTEYYLRHSLDLWAQVSVQFGMCFIACCLCYAFAAAKDLLTPTSSSASAIIKLDGASALVEAASEEMPATYLTFGIGSGWYNDQQRLDRSDRIMRYKARNEPKHVHFEEDCIHHDFSASDDHKNEFKRVHFEEDGSHHDFSASDDHKKEPNHVNFEEDSIHHDFSASDDHKKEPKHVHFEEGGSHHDFSASDDHKKEPNHVHFEEGGSHHDFSAFDDHKNDEHTNEVKYHGRDQNLPGVLLLIVLLSFGPLSCMAWLIMSDTWRTDFFGKEFWLHPNYQIAYAYCFTTAVLMGNAINPLAYSFWSAALTKPLRNSLKALTSSKLS